MSLIQPSGEYALSGGYPRPEPGQDGYYHYPQLPYTAIQPHPMQRQRAEVALINPQIGHQPPPPVGDRPSAPVTPDRWGNHKRVGSRPLPSFDQGVPLSLSHNTRGEYYPSNLNEYNGTYTPPPIIPYISSQVPLSRGDHYAYQPTTTNPSTLTSTRSFPTTSTLWWSDLEPWMDFEYAKSVCKTMSWNPVDIMVPPAPVSAISGKMIPNNAGYCLLTFKDSNEAQAVLAQVSDRPIMMPNSRRPFALSLAANVPSATLASAVTKTQEVKHGGSQPYALLSPQQEFSIFVGDLAPETSNSDLIDVFRDPVLGLRNDREPKYIRPFLSVKSAKIILDPLTGVSKGYGFVRFTDEAEMQRALIEMHGLYCLTRPMRVSPATAKNRHAALGAQIQPTSADSPSHANTPSVTNPTSCVASRTASITSHLTQKSPDLSASLGYRAADEALGHRITAGAILSRMIGPNGEQLTSLDPYNTTVFVGGLSPLVGEETLRTFFESFGEIHYVKVPAGKHCGFVQFVRKCDAKEAIEKMQGHPIAGSRIRLSWGRSQYKAAQAAAQAAQAAEMRAFFENQANPTTSSDVSYAVQPQLTQVPQAIFVQSPPAAVGQMSQEQAAQLIGNLMRNGAMSDEERLALHIVTATNNNGIPPSPASSRSSGGSSSTGGSFSDGSFARHPAPERATLTFSPFSPELETNGGVFEQSASLPRGYALGQQRTQTPSNGFYPGSVLWRHSSETSSPRSTRPPLSRAVSRQAEEERPAMLEDASIHDLNGTLKSLDLDGNSSSSLRSYLTERA